MSKKLDIPSMDPQSRDDIAVHIDNALKSSDIVVAPSGMRLGYTTFPTLQKKRE